MGATACCNDQDTDRHQIQTELKSSIQRSPHSHAQSSSSSQSSSSQSSSHSAQTPSQSSREANDNNNDNAEEGKLQFVSSNGNPFVLSFCEVCTVHTKFQCTMISTICEDSKNFGFRSLYAAGSRITDVSSVFGDGFIYFLIKRRNKQFNCDEAQIQKYQIQMNANSNEISNILHFENETMIILKNQDVNIEGIEMVIAIENDKHIGFVLCNDLYSKPNNSSLYYFDLLSRNVSILYSLDDDGISEMTGICYIHSEHLGLDGYCILTRSLCLSEKRDDISEPDHAKFEIWFELNQGNANIYYVDRKNLLEVIEYKMKNENDNRNDDGGYIAEKQIELEMISVKMQTNSNFSEKSVFKTYGKLDGYQCNGFEAIAIDNDNGNCLLSIEYSEIDNIKENTFNVIITGEFKDDGALQLIIDPCNYELIENNGGGAHSQQALAFCKPKVNIESP